MSKLAIHPKAYAAGLRRIALLASVPAFILIAAPAAHTQEAVMDAGALAHAVDRLAGTVRVLYIAAHPDDENTRLLAYLANSRHVTAAYLSMTRGGGGQNLIGPEQDSLLDVIRTEELLAARRLDAAVQRFTRMRDFGYSKTAEETLAIWNREEALADVVWIVRSFQPDVMITRFDEQPPNHGHHIASAILAREAFHAAADPNRYPEQLTRGVLPWQADRLLLNVPTWREGPPPEGSIALDVGGYDPRLGVSYGELAAFSRSQHKSQGFGVAGERGTLVERFVSIAGTKPSADILEGLTLDWSRFGTPARPLTKALTKARADLERDRPEQALPALLQAHEALTALPEVPRVRDARVALDEIIAAAVGLFVRATAAQPAAVPGAEVALSVETVVRRPASVRLTRLLFPGGTALEPAVPLSLNGKKVHSQPVKLAADTPISTPYWLARAPLPGRHLVSDPSLVGEATGPPPLSVGVVLEVEHRTVHLQAPVLYSWTDRVHGERLRTFRVVPPATVTPLRQAVLLANGNAGVAALRIRANQDNLRGTVALQLPPGWQAQPATAPISLASIGAESTIQFSIRGPADASAVDVEPVIEIDGRNWSYREDIIDYPHIPLQVVLQPASLRLAPLTVAVPSETVGYIDGSGDTVADDLAHLGLNVTRVDDETLRSGDLGRFAAIIVGIRAYNARPALRSGHVRLMRYVEDGGTVVVQYNTVNRWDPLELEIGPFPLKIGRGRITDETAAMTPVDQQHPLLLGPNRIGAADFAGWVQERGLYFAESWDDRYQPLLRVADPGEEPQLGGVLVARHGKGRYVYTGLAFFRQLPAGVSGAYRLLVNLIAAS